MNKPATSRPSTLAAEKAEITAFFQSNDRLHIDWKARAERDAKHRASVTYPYGPQRGSYHWENGRLVTKGFGS